MSYNIAFIKPQEQLELACALARNNEHARIGMLVDGDEFKALNFPLQEGDAYCAQTRTIALANGAFVKWLSPKLEHITDHSGVMLTTLFVGDNVHWKVVDYLQTRLRSSKFKGAFKTYYAHGHVMWEVWEQYGGE